MDKLVCMLRVKDGILFVNKWLNNIDKLVDEIVVVDNGSSDGTYEILKSHPKVVDIVRTQGFDEGRDKVLAYQMARERKPDWCLWLDIDEIFEDRLTRKAITKMMENKRYSKYSFRRYDFLDDYNHFYLYYFNFMHCFGFSRDMWKEQPTGYFENVFIHNGLIKGIKGKNKLSPYRIKHLGYVDKEYLIKKTTNYIKVDPNRKQLYIKHFSRPIGTKLRWYEYNEKPLLVLFQIYTYKIVYFFIRVLDLTKKIFKKVFISK